jgi:hypothetical protein
MGFVVRKHGSAGAPATGKKAMLAKVGREAKAGRFLAGSKTGVDAVMKAAKRSGLLGEKSRMIGVRISPALIEQASGTAASKPTRT